MKRITTIIAAFAACAALTACSSTPQNSDVSVSQNTDTFAGLKLKRAGITDRVVFNTLDELERSSHIAVVGTFINDAEQEVDYEYDPYFKKDIIVDINSTNTIEVTKVLMGDVNVGDKLSIDQNYGIVNGELISFSELTPMQKGDEWVFFLRKVAKSDHYVCTAESDSRFPTKSSASKNGIMPLAEGAELGVYDEADFNNYIYEEIVEKYDV